MTALVDLWEFRVTYQDWKDELAQIIKKITPDAVGQT
jgi:hypothetical protein